MSYQSDKNEAYKALSKKERAKLFHNLSDYERSTDLVTFHDDTLSVAEMSAFVRFARELEQTQSGVRFHGNSLRREKTWRELKETVKEKAYYRR